MSSVALAAIPRIQDLSISTLLSLDAEFLAYLLRQIPEQLLPSAYISSLSAKRRITCLRYCALTWRATAGQQCPKAEQCQAALAAFEFQDVFLRAGTGFGKTLVAVLNQMLREDDSVTFIITPMKRIQYSHALNISTKYGLETAVINDETPHDDAFWKRVLHDFKAQRSGTARVILVTPEQFFTCNAGHLSTFGQMIRKPQFLRRLHCVVVDEAHFPHTVGLPHYGLDAFRPSYGRLGELKVRLPRVPWIVATATAPLAIMKTIETTLLRPNYLKIELSVNRPNIAYATHRVVKSIDFLANYICFVKKPFDLASQPRVLIFRDDRAACIRIARFLDQSLPKEHRNKGVVRYYHSSMSQEYCDLAHKEFTEPNGGCRFLVSTSGQATGVDHLNVLIVCCSGLPSLLLDGAQRVGRAVCQVLELGLGIFFVDPWIDQVDISGLEDSEDVRRDADFPVGKTLTKKSTAQERVGFASAQMAKEDKVCIRAHLAKYLNDETDEALDYITSSCCTGHGLDLNSILPQPLYVAPQQEEKRKRPRAKLRPPAERELLEPLLQSWRLRAHEKDELSHVYPAYYILPDSHIE
ncbi:hypothetical protein K525DRAFT_263669 [Schizophyllum commune Loenen D]|nr:hypothetical protein K525DRAFT_263669 [Schizophyllum commune Loenen D]